MNYEQMLKQLQKNFNEFIEKQRNETYANISALGSSFQDEEEKIKWRLLLDELKLLQTRNDIRIEFIIAENLPAPVSYKFRSTCSE